MMLVNDETRRDIAIKRLKDKNDFRIHLLVYLAVNSMFVAIWVMFGGFFWPLFPIAGWGIGVLSHGYSVFYGNVYSEDQIKREMSKLPR